MVSDMQKILYVDKDKVLAEVVREIMQVFGMAVEHVTQTGVRSEAEWEEYSLLIVDWSITGGALAFCDKVLAEGYRGKLLVISSINVSNSTRLKLEQRGIKYLSKPFSVIGLADAVEKVLS